MLTVFEYDINEVPAHGRRRSQPQWLYHLKLSMFVRHKEYGSSASPMLVFSHENLDGCGSSYGGRSK